MIIIISLLLLSIMPSNAFDQDDFKNSQFKFDRVRTAYLQKGENLINEVRKFGISGEFQLFIAAYKAEGKLEVWLKGNDQIHYNLFRTYDFCDTSGTLGPKMVEGDRQIPEGFYHINVFNPMSNFHLSLGINYPNSVDLYRTGKNRKPGNEIYIHGGCVTVGCIPLTDDKIKELYILTVEARNSGQVDIPVYIFPFKMTDEKMTKYLAQFPQHTEFWGILQKGYLAFEKIRRLPKVIKVVGKYSIK